MAHLFWLSDAQWAAIELHILWNIVQHDLDDLAAACKQVKAEYLAE